MQTSSFLDNTAQQPELLTTSLIYSRKNTHIYVLHALANYCHRFLVVSVHN